MEAGLFKSLSILFINQREFLFLVLESPWHFCHPHESSTEAKKVVLGSGQYYQYSFIFYTRYCCHHGLVVSGTSFSFIHLAKVG